MLYADAGTKNKTQTAGRIAMKKCFLTIGFFSAGAGAADAGGAFLARHRLPYRLWEKLSYEAQCLRYPGGWGHSMKEGAQAQAEKK